MPNSGKNSILHCLPSDPNVRKEWMNFMFNEVPDRVSQELGPLFIHFAADLFTNNTIWCRIFRRLKTKRQWLCRLYWFDSNGATKVWVTDFIYNCFDSLFDIYWVFTAFNYITAASQEPGCSPSGLLAKNISYLQHYITAIYLSPSVEVIQEVLALQMTSWCRCCCSLPAQGMG